MKLFYDLLIAVLIIITALPAVILFYNRKKITLSWENSHPRLTAFFGCLLLFFALLTIYGSFIEPKILITNYQEIDLDNISQPVRIAFISDIHAGTYSNNKDIEILVQKIRQLNPDLVLLGGDQVDNEPGSKIDEVEILKPLKILTEKIPTFAVQGNHEYGIMGGNSIENPGLQSGSVAKEVSEYLESIGVKFLINQTQRIALKNEQLLDIFGGDEFWTHNLDLSKIKKEENIPLIALIHNPAAIYKASKYPIDLMLSGHTHGGQIRFPFIGPLGRVDEIIPAHWYQGLNQYHDLRFFVSSGAGQAGVRARLFNPREIVLITIK